jgi:hypothetical protein
MSFFIEKKKKSKLESNKVDINIKPKKGRRAKNSKIFLCETQISTPTKDIVSSNVILHLKCSLNDLKISQHNLIENQLIYNPEIPHDILKYSEKLNDERYFSIKENKNDYAYSDDIISDDIDNNISNTVTEDILNINSKLKDLKINLFHNNLCDKKSACFWCTYDFDNIECYIPKYQNNSTTLIIGYGCFCCPECATAFLMKENIDDSAKFERYHLLNQIYGNVYNFCNNIKPAPNPFYLLDKYYGNLNIHEYRQLLKTDHSLVVVDKPLTRLLPELHDDNDYCSDKLKQSNVTKVNPIYKVKKANDNVALSRNLC